MLTLKFDDYIVNNLSYRKNENYEKSEGGIEINPDFSAKILASESKAVVKISASITSKEDIPTPFDVEVTLSGFFEQDGYSKDKDDNEKFKHMLSANALAILFPYVRTLISDLTLKSNEYPAFNLPVMNFVEIMNKENKIEFIDVNLENE